jgi:hypothetical protein
MFQLEGKKRRKSLVILKGTVLSLSLLSPVVHTSRGPLQNVTWVALSFKIFTLGMKAWQGGMVRYSIEFRTICLSYIIIIRQ